MGTAVAIIGVGYVLGAVALRWMLRDLRRMHAHLWSGHGTPDPWHRAAWLSWFLGGWPALVTAAVWARSPTRRRMLTVWRRSWRRRSRRDEAPPGDGART